jgi:hypothetical protein
MRRLYRLYYRSKVNCILQKRLHQKVRQDKMTDTQKTAKQQLEELVAQERREELLVLAQTIENDFPDKFSSIEVTEYVVYLYDGSHLLVVVPTMNNWNKLKAFASVVNNPSNAEIQAMQRAYEHEN